MGIILWKDVGMKNTQQDVYQVIYLFQKEVFAAAVGTQKDERRQVAQQPGIALLSVAPQQGKDS